MGEQPTGEPCDERCGPDLRHFQSLPSRLLLEFDRQRTGNLEKRRAYPEKEVSWVSLPGHSRRQEDSGPDTCDEKGRPLKAHLLGIQFR